MEEIGSLDYSINFWLRSLIAALVTKLSVRHNLTSLVALFRTNSLSLSSAFCLKQSRDCLARISVPIVLAITFGRSVLGVGLRLCECELGTMLFSLTQSFFRQQTST